MADVYFAESEADLGSYVKNAAASRTALEVCGFRSKRAAGRPLQPVAVLSTAKLNGITHYHPDELVISAAAGTPLHEVEAVLDEHNQQLAFEPAYLSRLFAPDAMAMSIGAVAAMNISGPRRILRGAARDHLLGVRAVNGRGETIISGGRVLKNVTGVDLVKGLAGSWGTLAVLTEVSFKVLPRSKQTRTVMFLGLTHEAAVSVMSLAMGTPYEVSGTLHLDEVMALRISSQMASMPSQSSLTALRLEGRGHALDEHVQRLRLKLAPFGESYEIGHDQSNLFWADVRHLSFLSSDFEKPLWRLSVAPSKAASIVRALQAFFPLHVAYEWSGGLIWLELPDASDASVTEVRRVLAEFKADAMLMRAKASIRSSIDVFHPLPLAEMKLVQALKTAFDPVGIFNSGRMYANV